MRSATLLVPARTCTLRAVLRTTLTKPCKGSPGGAEVIRRHSSLDLLQLRRGAAHRGKSLPPQRRMPRRVPSPTMCLRQERTPWPWPGGKAGPLLLRRFAPVFPKRELLLPPLARQARVHTCATGSMGSGGHTKSFSTLQIVERCNGGDTSSPKKPRPGRSSS